LLTIAFLENPNDRIGWQDRQASDCASQYFPTM
jgi:hypothetical protein